MFAALGAVPRVAPVPESEGPDPLVLRRWAIPNNNDTAAWVGSRRAFGRAGGDAFQIQLAKV